MANPKILIVDDDSLGATAFFQKPADNAELLGTIRAVLDPA
jgi:hypothetical protein